MTALPPLLTARNATRTARTAFADEGYTGPLEVREAPGLVEILVGPDATDRAIEVAGGRLAEIKNTGVELRITRRPR